MYERNLGCEGPLDVFRSAIEIANLEKELGEWLRRLPAPLKIGRSFEISIHDGDTAVEQRLNTVLTLRYLNARLLLHRPIVVKLLAYLGGEQHVQTEVDYLVKIGPSSIHSLVKDSTELIMIINDAIQQNRILGAWWFNLYYSNSIPIKPSAETEQLNMIAFNASLLLFGALLVSLKAPVRHMIDQSRIRVEVTGVMSRASSALQNMNGGSIMVRKCCVYLEWLIRVSENMSRSWKARRSILITFELSLIIGGAESGMGDEIPVHQCGLPPDSSRPDESLFDGNIQTNFATTMDPGLLMLDDDLNFLWR